MNNPLKGEDGSRNAIGLVSLVVSLIAYGAGLAFWVSQTNTNFADRLKFLEDQQALSRVIEDKLNTAREETNVHFATTDAKIGEIDKKVGAMFEFLQQESAAPPPGGSQNVGPENFPPTQGGGR